MTDAPFTPAHRAMLEKLRGFSYLSDAELNALRAALAEIARLDETHDYWQARAEKAEARLAQAECPHATIGQVLSGQIICRDCGQEFALVHHASTN